MKVTDVHVSCVTTGHNKPAEQHDLYPKNVSFVIPQHPSSTAGTTAMALDSISGEGGGEFRPELHKTCLGAAKTQAIAAHSAQAASSCSPQ